MNLNLNIRNLQKTWRVNRSLKMFGELSFQGVLLQKCCILSAEGQAPKQRVHEIYALNCMDFVSRVNKDSYSVITISLLCF